MLELRKLGLVIISSCNNPKNMVLNNRTAEKWFQVKNKCEQSSHNIFKIHKLVPIKIPGKKIWFAYCSHVAPKNGTAERTQNQKESLPHIAVLPKAMVSNWNIRKKRMLFSLLRAKDVDWGNGKIRAYRTGKSITSCNVFVNAKGICQ